ncbi:hypothetical protein [Janthinobacterium fluminis]|uniref:Uncharacterized protein n=1 Tax=Janthinobacterium fluminis TaxID=2987524 RepID=A0ABT5K113_9BURK|nr:hypothetical protein [Janthinobacterium fluminis]MDC8758645.1 hypothetical protein [Janthinobacterium fluminis]
MSLIERLVPPVLCLHLAPQRLGWALRRGGRAVPGSAARLAVDNPDGHWQVTLEALDAWLHRPDRPGAGQPLEISLASRWCQMALAPWSEALLAEPGAGHYLRSQLAALYGEGARAWDIGSDDAPYGQPRLVCGVDAALPQALRQLAAGHGHRCDAIEPVLTLAWRAIAATRPQAFAVAEAGRLVLAAVSGGRIVALQAQASGADWRAELARAWLRWRLRAPELGAVERVAVIDLSGAPAGELAAPFAPVAAGLLEQSAWA